MGQHPDDAFLSFADIAPERAAQRLPGTNRSAMEMVLLLYRVTSTIVYDIESTVHRPAGWSWSAFRLLFTLWVAGPQEASRAAELSGMSRAAVSSLSRTLSTAGLLERGPDERDRRGVVLSLSAEGTSRLETALRVHNQREAEWAALLTPDELAVFNSVLGKLARAARSETWVSHRF